MSDLRKRAPCPSRQQQSGQTLCHELGHALTHAVYGSKTTSPAKNSSWFSDAGYDLQAAIFGGIPTERRRVHIPAGPHNWRDEEYQDIWMLQEWPCDLICLEKMQDNKRFGGFVYDPEPCTYVTVMPRELILGVFREEFWRRKERDDRFGTLRPVEVPGWLLGLECGDYERIWKGYYREPSDDDTDDEEDSDSGQDSEDDYGSDSHSDEESDDEECFDDDEESSDEDEDCYSASDSDSDDEDSNSSFRLRMVEYNEQDLDEDAATRLREIVRRQWLQRSSSDPADVLDSASWLWDQ